MIGARKLTLAASAAAMLVLTAAQSEARPAQPPIVDTSAKRWLEGTPAANREPEHVTGRRSALKHPHHRKRRPYKHHRDAAPPSAPPRRAPS